MTISKTKIKQRTSKKTDNYLVETIKLAKDKGYLELAQLLCQPTKKRVKKNLFEIDSFAKEGKKVIVPGKVLGTGVIKKKIEIIALSFSSSAVEKLKKSKIPAYMLHEEISKKEKLEGDILK